jgi:DNA-directed RNA polymerase subunit RPC12/RpoP
MPGQPLTAPGGFVYHAPRNKARLENGPRPLCFFAAMSLVFAAIPFALAAQEPQGIPDAPNPSPSGTEFYHDFRNKKSLDGNFKLYGADAANRVKSEPEGLRITLPGKAKSPDGLGVISRLPVKGNFEITLGYEIVQMDKPKDLWGNGFELYIETDTPTKESMGLNRIIRPTGADVYFSSRMRTNLQGGHERVERGTDIPAAGKAGQLRITRHGPKTVLSAIENGSKEGQVLYRYDLGTEDIAMIRLAAIPGNTPFVVDLRLIDLLIKELPDVAPIDPGVKVVDKSAAPPRTALWLAVVLIAVALVAISLWLLLRRARGNSEEKKLTEQASTPAVEVRQKVKPATAPGPLAFQCLGCGKQLKTKAELAGKKIKCPECGNAVAVPRIDESSPRFTP